MEKELIDNMAIEDEVLEKLGDHETKLKEHDTRLNQHGEKLHELEIKNAGYDARFDFIDSEFNTIKISLARIENSSLQSSNILLSTLSQIAINTSTNSNEIVKDSIKNEGDIKKIKLNNNLKISLKILAILGACLAGYLTSEYGINIKF